MEQSALETFYQYHHCDKPMPASDKPNVWGGIRCLRCGYNVMVVSWLGGMESVPPLKLEPSPDRIIVCSRCKDQLQHLNYNKNGTIECVWFNSRECNCD